MNSVQTAVAEDLMHTESGADQYLTFILADEEYGVDILRVQEIKGWNGATPIPNTPDHIMGVINLRGTIVPIIDLRRRFGMESVEFGPMTVVIVLRVQGEERERTMGIVVDAVSEVYNVKPDEMKPPPDLGDAIETQFIQGMATVDEKMVILLNIDRLLSCGDLPSVAAAEEPAEEPA